MASTSSSRDDYTVVVIGHGPYKHYIAEVLREQGYVVKETKDFKHIPITTTSGSNIKIGKIPTTSMSSRGNEILSPSHSYSILSARAWISTNALRRLPISTVKIVYCIESSPNSSQWIKVAKGIFSNYNSVVIVTQKTDNRQCGRYCREAFAGGCCQETLDINRQSVIICSYNRNTSQCNNECHIIQPDTNRRVIHIEGQEFVPRLNLALQHATPFTITNRSAQEDSRLPHPWDNERIILFGRSGSGKSTLTNMLVHKSPDGETGLRVSDAPMGTTLEVIRAEGRGWCVVDTPGLGEYEGGSISEKEAKEKVAFFLAHSAGMHSHFIYVIKNDRLTFLDTKFWNIFKHLFKGAESNFTVVITSTKREPSEGDKGHFREEFGGCDNFVYVNFPSTSEEEIIEESRKRVRVQSLRTLENKLESLYLADVETDIGRSSEGSRQFQGWNRIAINLLRSDALRVDTSGPSNRPSSSSFISGISSMSIMDDSIRRSNDDFSRHLSNERDRRSLSETFRSIDLHHHNVSNMHHTFTPHSQGGSGI
jgi:GTP-binding protein EngB required for normal cell division